MSNQPKDPDVQAMFDEADALPECAAQSAILERIAARCEALGDLHSAWNVRCRILGSKASYHDLKFENIFMNLAWCLAVSDADPVEFSPSPVLWQYKWVASAAPDYAAVSRNILERIVTDMDERFIRAGWGRRAGLMKRMELYQTLGEYDRAMEVAREWRAVPRDRGADCPACEANTYASLLFDTGDVEQAIKECRPIIKGTLSCSTVPHSTFGALLMPLAKLGRLTQAEDLYRRGRRLVFSMEEGAHQLAHRYILFAAMVGKVDEAMSMLRSTLADAAGIRSNLHRYGFSCSIAATMACLADRGVETVELPAAAGLLGAGMHETAALSGMFASSALADAQALDHRNGNITYAPHVAKNIDHARRVCHSL